MRRWPLSIPARISGRETLYLEKGELQWKMTLKGELFQFGSYRCPGIKLEKDALTDQNSERMAVFFERMYVLEEGLQLFDSLPVGLSRSAPVGQLAAATDGRCGHRLSRMSDLLFVYGTLQSQGAAHHLLVGQATFLGSAWLQGRLYEVGGYPGAVLSDNPRERIHGELYRMASAGSSAGATR